MDCSSSLRSHRLGRIDQRKQAAVICLGQHVCRTNKARLPGGVRLSCAGSFLDTKHEKRFLGMDAIAASRLSGCLDRGAFERNPIESGI